MLILKDVKILKEETVIDKKTTSNMRSLDQIINDGLDLNKFELSILNTVIVLVINAIGFSNRNKAWRRILLNN